MTDRHALQPGQKFWWNGGVCEVTEISAKGIFVAKFVSSPCFADEVLCVQIDEWINGKPVRMRQLEEGFCLVSRERLIQLQEAERRLRMFSPQPATRNPQPGGCVA